MVGYHGNLDVSMDVSLGRAGQPATPPDARAARNQSPFTAPLDWQTLDAFTRMTPAGGFALPGLMGPSAGHPRLLARLREEWTQKSEQLQAIEAHKGALGSVWHGMKRLIGVSGSQSQSWAGRLWSAMFDSDLTRGALVDALQAQAGKIAELETLARQGDGAGFDRAFERLTGMAPADAARWSQNPDHATAALLDGGERPARVEAYAQSQRHGVDGLSDLTVAALTLGALPFLIANPVSLAGLGVALGAGAVVKVALKLFDAATASQTQYSFGQFVGDALTGGISGAGAGLGGWVASRWLGSLAANGSALIRSPLRFATAYAAADGATQGVTMSLNTYQYAREDGADAAQALRQTLWAIPFGGVLGALGGAGVGALTGRMAHRAGHGPLGGGARLVAQGEQNAVARMGSVGAAPGEENLLVFNLKPDAAIRRQKLLNLDAVSDETPIARWTQEYAGGAKIMRETEHRWGLALTSREEALAKGLLLPDGSLNLPAGRYLYVVKADGSLVIGRESRGAADSVVAALKENPARTDIHGMRLEGAETPLETRAFQGVTEILDVTNHSSLAGRGLPYDPARADDFAIRAAGEIRVNGEGRIVTQNDQTGQFTLHGATVPPHDPHFGGRSVLKTDAFNGAAALKYGHRRLEALTGQSGFDVNVIEFVARDQLAPNLRRPTLTPVAADQMDGVAARLGDARLQDLLNAGILRPEEQQLLIRGLSNGETNLDELNAVIDRLVEKKSLKAEPAARLKAAILSHDEALDMFRPGHETAKALKEMKLSVNARRKLALAIALHLEDDWVASRNGITFQSVLQRLMNDPDLMTLLFQTGRPSRGVARQALWRLDRASECAPSILKLFAGKPKRLEGALGDELKALAGLRDVIQKAENGKPNSPLAQLLRQHGVDVDAFYAFVKTEASKRRGHEQIVLGYALQNDAFAELLRRAGAQIDRSTS